MANVANQESEQTSSRRDFLSSVFMWGGLALAYGVLGIEGILFLLPEKVGAATRRLFAGSIEKYSIGDVQSFYDLQGGEILVKRDETGFKAFNNVCPHLGCRVHWEADNNRFFCPCHRGAFDADGNPIAGPPKDANQSLFQVPVTIDDESGVVYLEVKDI